MRVYAIYDKSRWILVVCLVLATARLSVDVWVSLLLYYIPELQMLEDASKCDSFATVSNF